MSIIRTLMVLVTIGAARVAAWGQSPTQTKPATVSPIAVQTGQAQLFVDDAVIDTQADLKRTLHRPRKDFGGHQPIIPAGPHDGLLAYGSIVRDDRLGKYVAFLRAHGQTAYFRTTSADGLNWDAARRADLTPVRFDMSNLEQEPGTRGTPGLDLFLLLLRRRQ